MSLDIVYQKRPSAPDKPNARSVVEDCCVDSGGGHGGLSATAMMEVAFEEARAGLAEGGVPIGAALFTTDGVLLGSGRNRPCATRGSVVTR
jgi:hypothetical protein